MATRQKNHFTKSRPSPQDAMTFLRRLSNPFTTWQARSPPSHDITEVTKDNIFLLHLSFVETFCRLDEESLLTAYIVSNKSAATKILEACHQLAIINPSNGEPATANIDRGMVRAMPSLSVGKQRELVMLLFFWEEEVRHDPRALSKGVLIMPGRSRDGSF